MKNLAHIAAHSVHEAQTRGPREASATVRKLFVVLHGAYGNQFLAKFHTGQLVEDGPNKGKDKGPLAAMLVWDADLSRFPGDVVETAAKRAMAESPQFSPSLPELVKLCEAILPRKTHAELNGYALLPAPKLARVEARITPVGDGKDWARVIKARAEAGDQTVTFGVLRHALQALGAEATKKPDQDQEGENDAND
ncbi:hypothetical protein [Delftia sp. GW456-R20]|uniref:hypothetical protein n=1 Tax=Delftia sp. GW456-R20 TaxID=1827145 RepID=UPI000B23177A|nr:hypothetical protein [Delftia sp. GW456-R20]